LQKRQSHGKISPLENIGGGFMKGKKGSDVDDYYILFRDTNAPDPTPAVYKERSKEEDLFLADKASYVWGYVGKLKDFQARFVQRSLDKPFEEGFKEKIGLSNAGIPSKYAFEIAVRNPFDRTRKELIKASPELAFISSMHHYLLHFWYYPESDEESLQIKQILESQVEKGGRGIYWHMHTLTVPKTHRSFVQLLSFDALINGLKRLDYWRNTGAPRRAAAIWVIETTLEPVKLTRPGFTRSRPVMTVPHLFNTPSDARAAFESVVLNDKKYIPALTEHQLEVLERGVTVANNIRTTFHCGYLNIENKYEVFRTNGTLEPKAQLQEPMMEKIDNKIDKLQDRLDKLDKILPVVSADNPNSVPKNDTAETKSAAEGKPNKTLEPPKTTMDWEVLVAGIFQEYPETKTFTSARLLLYIKDWARQQGVVIKLSDSRIRKLEVWKKNARHRQSGSTRYGHNSDDIASVDATEDTRSAFQSFNEE
jgi:hypothetical protein